MAGRLLTWAGPPCATARQGDDTVAAANAPAVTPSGRGGDFEVDMDLVVGKHKPAPFIPVDHAASCKQRHIGMDTLEITPHPPCNLSNAQGSCSRHRTK